MKITKIQLRKIIESLVIESVNNYDRAALSDLGLDNSFVINVANDNQIVIRKKINNDNIEMAGESSRWDARDKGFKTPYEKKSLQPDPISPEYGYFYYKN